MDARFVTQGTSPEPAVDPITEESGVRMILSPEDEGPIRKPTIELRIPMTLFNDEDINIIRDNPDFFERETVPDVSEILGEEDLEEVNSDDDFWRTPVPMIPAPVATLDAPFGPGV